MTLPNIPPALRAAACRPLLRFGRGILAAELAALPDCAVLTMPEPWAVVEPLLRQRPAAVYFVTTLERAALEAAEGALPSVGAVAGVGGGTALDSAKYVTWRRGLPYVAVPTAVSVDAMVTNTVALREAGRVRYVGFVVPQVIVVDLAVIGQAPPHLNRAGVGDILSFHTALWDWRAAAGAAGVPPEAMAEARSLLEELDRRATEVAAGSDEGLRFLVEAYTRENALCLECATSQPEEGSEHFWAYHLEALTRRPYVHGELVSLGVYLMAVLQDNNPQWVRDFLTRAGVRYHPRQLEIARDEMASSLLGLRDYVRRQGFPHSVIDERPIDEALVERLTASLEFAG